MSEKDKKPVVYVAGKMRGVPYYNFRAFDAARDRLLKLGFEVLSPADMDRAEGFDPTTWVMLRPNGLRDYDWSVVPHDFDLAAAIERDNKAIDMADAIYVIHEGISESAGGMAEIERGMRLGKIIVYDTMDDEAILKALGMQTVGMPDILLCPASIAKSVADIAQMRMIKLPPSTADEVRYTDPTTGGQKGDKLARHDLLPPDIVHELAEHYGKGARKYADRNMEKGYPWSKSYAACHRHLNAFWRGEDVDPEMGSLHLIAAAWHCFTMAWFLRHNKGTDDRPKA